MILGVSVGDFIAVADLTKRVVSSIKSAPEDFSETEKTLQNLDILLDTLRNEIESPTSLLTRDADQARHFDILIRSFRKPLNRLVAILEKYPSLGSGKAKLVERIKFPQKDVIEIQQELTRRYATLITFLETVGIGGIGRVEDGLNRTRRRVDSVAGKVDDVHGKINIVGDQIDDVHDSVADVGGKVDFIRLQQARLLSAVERMANERNRMRDTGSLLSDHTNDNKGVWRQLRRDLNLAGFKSCVIERHKMLIHSKLIELQQLGLMEWDAASVADDSTSSTRTFTGYPRGNYKPPTMNPIFEESIPDDMMSNTSYRRSLSGAPAPRDRVSQHRPRYTGAGKKQSNYRQPAAKTVHDESSDEDGRSESTSTSIPQGSRGMRNLGEGFEAAPSVAGAASSYFNAERMAEIIKVDDESVFLRTREGERIELSLSSLSLDEMRRVDLWRWQQSTKATVLPKEDRKYAYTDARTERLPKGKRTAKQSGPGLVYDTEIMMGKRSEIRNEWRFRLPGERIRRSTQRRNNRYIGTSSSPVGDLLWAAENGKVEEVRILIDQGVDLEATDASRERRGHRSPDSLIDCDCCTALARAATNGHLPVAHLLLRSGADPDVAVDSKALVTRLVEESEVDMLRLFLEYEVAFKHLRTLKLGAKIGNVEVVQLLLDFGADVDGDPSTIKPSKNIMDPSTSPLFAAVRNDNIRVTELLLREGADPESSYSPGGPSALGIAVAVGHHECARLLLLYGADPNDSKDLVGDSPLADACYRSDERMVKMLLRRNADPNMVRERLSPEQTTGHIISTMSLVFHTAMARLDPAVEKYSPLYHAAENGNVNIVRILIEYGANVNSEFETDEQAIDVARKKGHRTVVRVLRAAGARSK